jgi:hypothetical protein
VSGVHEDGVGSPFLYKVYRRGCIVRRGDDWGVVTRGGDNPYHSDPEIIWLTDDGEWTLRGCYNRNTYDGQNISAPYAHTYAGIPDIVLAKATEIMLLGDNA